MIKKSTDLARKMAEKIAKFYATFFSLPPVTFFVRPCPTRPARKSLKMAVSIRFIWLPRQVGTFQSYPECY